METTYEILETCEKSILDNDFPDEFCHSKDKIRVEGGLMKKRKQRKAGIVMIQDLAYQNMMKMENLKDIIYILQKCL